MQIVTFYSDRFSMTPLPDAINDVLGHDLMTWLLTGLRERGYEAGDVIGEDFGYGFWVPIRGASWWVYGNLYEPAGEEGQGRPRWLVGISGDAGCLLIDWRKPKPTPEQGQRLAQDIHALLRSDHTLGDMQWWEREIDVGTPSDAP